MDKKLESVVRENLPFTVELATNASLLSAAVQVRQAAYARHLPDVAEKMVEAESWDHVAGATVFVALAKGDRAPLGTIRIHTNEFAPLPLEQSIVLPEKFSGLRLVEATRLAVTGDTIGSLVKLALCKAYFHYCLNGLVDYMAITARRPLDRMYERMLFTDVDEKVGFMPMAHVGGIPHRVMHQGLKDIAVRWKQRSHPLYGFMYQTLHPDIKVAQSTEQVTNASAELM